MSHCTEWTNVGFVDFYHQIYISFKKHDYLACFPGSILYYKGSTPWTPRSNRSEVVRLLNHIKEIEVYRNIKKLVLCKLCVVARRTYDDWRFNRFRFIWCIRHATDVADLQVVTTPEIDLKHPHQIMFIHAIMNEIM